MLPEVITPVTSIKLRVWKKIVTLESDGSPPAFLDAIAAAVQKVGLPVLDRDCEKLTLRFESKGGTEWSWSGVETTVVLSAHPVGSVATFTSKRFTSERQAQKSVDARTWVWRLVPGFGELWKGPKQKPML
jgi:hypothetical protein